jgi:hypothetical protein
MVGGRVGRGVGRNWVDDDDLLAECSTTLQDAMGQTDVGHVKRGGDDGPYGSLVGTAGELGRIWPSGGACTKRIRRGPKTVEAARYATSVGLPNARSR